MISEFDFVFVLFSFQVEIIGIPGHLKRIKSPLESGIFNTIKGKFSELAISMSVVDPTKTILRHKFPVVFSETVDQSCMPGYIKTVFRKSGIYPLDASVCMAPIASTQASTTASTISVTGTSSTAFNLPSITTVASHIPQNVLFDAASYNSCALQPHVPSVQQIPPPTGQLPTMPSHTHASSSLHPASAHLSSSHLTSAHVSSSHLTSSSHISTSHTSHVHHHHGASHLPTASQLASSHLSSMSHLTHLAPSASQLTPAQLQYYSSSSADGSHPAVRNLSSHVAEPLFVLPTRQYNEDQTNRSAITSTTTYTEEVIPRPSVLLPNEDYIAEMVAREDAEKRAVAGMVGMHSRHIMVPHLQAQTQQQQQHQQQQQQQHHHSHFAKKRMKLS